MPARRYYLAQDHDYSWYVVPVWRATDFNEWKDRRAQVPGIEVPGYATRLPGQFPAITFEEPQIGGV